jgi:hypothetical protein
MTQAPHKGEPRWAELSDEILGSVEAGRKKAIDAVHKFVERSVRRSLTRHGARPLLTLPWTWLKSCPPHRSSSCAA